MAPELSIARLQALASRLRLGGSGFDMGNWKHCALGIATHMQEFKLLGLKLIDGALAFNRREGFAAAADFFGIDYCTALKLFCPDHYFLYGRFTTQKTVAKRIDRVINKLRKASEKLREQDRHERGEEHVSIENSIA